MSRHQICVNITQYCFSLRSRYFTSYSFYPHTHYKHDNSIKRSAVVGLVVVCVVASLYFLVVFFRIIVDILLLLVIGCGDVRFLSDESDEEATSDEVEPIETERSEKSTSDLHKEGSLGDPELVQKERSEHDASEEVDHNEENLNNEREFVVLVW